MSDHLAQCSSSLAQQKKELEKRKNEIDEVQEALTYVKELLAHAKEHPKDLYLAKLDDTVYRLDRQVRNLADQYVCDMQVLAQKLSAQDKVIKKLNVRIKNLERCERFHATPWYRRLFCCYKPIIDDISLETTSLSTSEQSPK